MNAAIRKPLFWVGAALCVGGLTFIALVVITPTYLRAMLGLH